MKILVGIDDSPNARSALRWAIDHSTLDDEVVALHVWHFPVAGGVEASMLDPDIFRSAAVRTLQRVVDDVTDSDDEAGRITQHLVMGFGAQEFLHAAEEADLLVLGARGHGGFAGLLLGSVTNTVVNHAPCPTVVVPLDEANRAG